MLANNGYSGSARHHMFEHQVDALKEGVKRVADRVSAAREPARAYAGKATGLIKAHPFAAIAIAFGIGYVAIRFARR